MDPVDILLIAKTHDLQWLVCCLGNPGDAFNHTRHNVGFWLADVITGRWQDVDTVSYRHYELFFDRHDRRGIGIQKPLTYMNVSGKALRSAIDTYHIPLDHVLVVYDDVDIPLGTVRYRQRGSSGTHNGMRSVVESVASQDIARLRIGIGPKPDQTALNDFVLGCFSIDEHAQLAPVFDDAIALISNRFLREGTT